MDKIVVEGGVRLAGKVRTGGAKNSVLPILFSTLLCDGKHVLQNVPKLRDIDSAQMLLSHLGTETQWQQGNFCVNTKRANNLQAPYEIVRKMRASILCLGPLLTRYHKAIVSLPGGCAIGTRPIDLHLEVMRTLGAEIEVKEGYVHAHAPNGLKGDTIVFDGVTVGGTENALMAAVLAQGETIIENAAKEPEVVDLADYLNKMGAKIKGAGRSIIHVQGVQELKPSEHKIIPDRIEAGTLLIAGAITGGEVEVTDCVPEHLEALIFKMREIGFKVETTENSAKVLESTAWKATDVTTAPYPGFATDLQAQFMALMTQAEGSSVISESIFENRFMHVQELNRLNANITPRTHVAIVRGKKGELQGADVMATDLRASACLILAGLVAQGKTTVHRVYHLDRGYEKLEAKLASLGAKIQRI